MEVYVLDKDFTLVGAIDSYNSFIWTERYAEAGDFELSMPASFNAINLLQQDRYVRIKDSDTLMIIEKIEVKTENRAQHMIVSGRSIVSILDRRVVLGLRYLNYVTDPATHTTIEKNIWELAQILLNENVISPENYSIYEESDEALKSYHNLYKLKRKISNIQIGTLIDPYEKIVSKKPKDLQYNGETIYDAIKTLCDRYHIGFKMTYNELNNKFIFSMYDGLDHTNDILLSPQFDNIANIGYSETKQGYKNVIIGIGQEGLDYIQKYAIRNGKGQDLTIDDSNPSGLELREFVTDLSNDIKRIYVDDRGDQKEDPSDNAYRERLNNRADEIISDNNSALKAFDGELINNARYKVKEDYNLGDLIKMTDNLGHSAKMRVTEIIYTHNASGYKVYPTLTVYEKDEYESDYYVS